MVKNIQKKQDKKICCTYPPEIKLDCLDQCKNYNIAKNHAFCLFKSHCLAQSHNGAKVSFSKDCKSLSLKYDRNCEKDKSPGFAVLLKTCAGERYRIETTAKLYKGDKAFIHVQSVCPDYKLLSKNPIIYDSTKSFEITFQAISDLTLVGMFFHCHNKDYLLKCNKFKVLACNPKAGCPRNQNITGNSRCQQCHHRHCRCHYKNACSKCLKTTECNNHCHSGYECVNCHKCTSCLKCHKCKSCVVCCICYSPCLVHHPAKDEISSSSSEDGTISFSDCESELPDPIPCDPCFDAINVEIRTCTDCPEVDPSSGIIALCRKCAVQCDYILENPCPHICGLQSCLRCARCSTCLKCNKCCSCEKCVICSNCFLCVKLCKCSNQCYVGDFSNCIH